MVKEIHQLFTVCKQPFILWGKVSLYEQEAHNGTQMTPQANCTLQLMHQRK